MLLEQDKAGSHLSSSGRRAAISLRFSLKQGSAVEPLYLAPETIIGFDMRFGASVDPTVGLSAFVDASEFKSDTDAGRRIPVGPQEAAFWHAFDLWNSIEEMRRHTIPLEVDVEAFAFGVDPTATASPDAWLGALLQTPPPERDLDYGSTFLGCDVADRFGFSFLFRTNLLATDPSLRSVAGTLTPEGLVADRERAAALGRAFDGRDKAHAPFYSYAIYRLGTFEAVFQR